MPRPVRNWLWTLVALCAAIGVIAVIDKHYAVGVIMSFFRGEIAMLYLMEKAHASQLNALLIAIACSTLNIGNCFWWEKQLEAMIIAWFHRKAPWLKNFFSIPPSPQVKLVPPTPPVETRFRKLAKKFPYVILPLYCFDPFFGVPLGVIFAGSSRLNMKVAFVVLACGNIAEKIIWSYIIHGSRRSIQNAVMPIVYISLAVVITASVLRFLFLNNNNKTA